MRWWIPAWWMVLPWGIVLPARAGEGDDPERWIRAIRAGRIESVEVLWKDVPSRALLEAALRSPEQRLRVAGAIRAGETGALWAADLLRELARGRSPGVSMASRLALRRLGLGGGDPPLRSVIWPGADLDREVRKGGRLEWVFRSRDGARVLREHLREASKDLGWRQERDLVPEEVPSRCDHPWGGVFVRDVHRATLLVCGGDLPGQTGILRISILAPQEEGARILLGIPGRRLDRR